MKHAVALRNNPNPDLPIAVLLRERRKALGLPQGDIAHAIVIAQSSVAYWETGAAIPVPRRLDAIAAAYGVTREELEAAISASRDMAAP